LPPGRRGRIIKIQGGRLLTLRLYQMGLYPGSIIQVINNRGAGPLTVKVLDVSIALGRGIAEKILVEPLD